VVVFGGDVGEQLQPGPVAERISKGYGVEQLAGHPLAGGLNSPGMLDVRAESPLEDSRNLGRHEVI
jgi:hypothetical protein